MADINVERKGPSIWPWIIGLLVLAALIWIVTQMFDGDDEDTVITDPAAEAPAAIEPGPEPTGATAMVAALPVTEIIRNPEAFTGRTVSGEATARGLVGQRGLWAEDAGGRVFVLLDDARPAELADGVRIRLTNFRVVSGDEIDDQPTSDPDARDAAEDEDAVLVGPASNVEIMDGTHADDSRTGVY